MALKLQNSRLVHLYVVSRFGRFNNNSASGIMSNTVGIRRNQSCELKKPEGIPPAEPIDIKEDWIGPPDAESNLRPVKFCRSPNMTLLEKKYLEEREKVQEWNQAFWSSHNREFVKQKEEFLRRINQEVLQPENSGDISTPRNPSKTSSDPLPVDQLSDYYRKFLDGNRTLHRNYNREWYRKNTYLIWLAFQVNIQRLYRRMTPRSIKI